MPLELEAAVERVANGPIERVDVGEVNGRVFINNSSLGLYPRDRARPRTPAEAPRARQVAGAALGEPGGVAPLPVPERSPVGRRRRAPAANAVRLHRQQRVPDGGLRDRRARTARRRPPQRLRRPAREPAELAAAGAARARRPAQAGARLRGDGRRRDRGRESAPAPARRHRRRDHAHGAAAALPYPPASPARGRRQPKRRRP